MRKIKTNIDLTLALQNELSIIITKSKSCSVCNTVKGKLELIEDDYPDVAFYEVYIEDLPIIQGQFLIFTLPTVLVFNYNKELLRESRFVRMYKITNILDNYLEKK